MKQLTSFKTYRHQNHPLEKLLHDNFIQKHIQEEKYTCPIDLLIFPAIPNNDLTPSDYLSDREKQIVISTIQWIGSPVGQTFLKDCGFSINK